MIAVNNMQPLVRKGRKAKIRREEGFVQKECREAQEFAHTHKSSLASEHSLFPFEIFLLAKPSLDTSTSNSQPSKPSAVSSKSSLATFVTTLKAKVFGDDLEEDMNLCDLLEGLPELQGEGAEAGIDSVP